MEFTNGEEGPKYFQHDIIPTQGNYYWQKQKKNKTIIKHNKVDTSLLEEIERKKEYYDFIPSKKSRHIEEAERIRLEEEYLRKKKAKEDILFFGRN